VAVLEEGAGSEGTKKARKAYRTPNDKMNAMMMRFSIRNPVLFQWIESPAMQGVTS
jgi:hypothetical protein